MNRLLMVGIAGGCVAWLTSSGCCSAGGGGSSDGAVAISSGRASRPQVYYNPRARAIKRVAVMPFKAPTELIGSSVSDMFVSELLHNGRYELVERSQMSNVLGEAEVSLSGLTSGQAVELGAMTGAEGVIIGTVGEYEMAARRGRTVPVVAITSRLIDCTSGQVVWSVDYAAQASTSSTLSEHARHAVRQMVSAIRK